MSDRKTVLNAGEYLFEQSLFSPTGTYALEHRADGTLVLRDNSSGRDVWRIGEPVPQPGWLCLLTEGLLVLRSAAGVLVWTSERIDHRVTAALVRDDGRLVLVDADGNQRWSRDPLDDAGLNHFPPAEGDLSVTPDGTCSLRTPSQSGQGCREVWSRRVGTPGAVVSLGQDGVLSAGTDSTVRQRWTGRPRLDPSSAEEARLVQSEREFARAEARDKARTVRPRGTAPDWYDSLELSGFFTITWVQGVDGREALSRLGAEADMMTTMTYDEAVSAACPENAAKPGSALAVPVDGWVLVIEPNGVLGKERAAEMSAGTQAVVYHESGQGGHFSWHRDGQPLTAYAEDGSPSFLVEIACLVTGTAPRPEDFGGTHLGAVSPGRR